LVQFRFLNLEAGWVSVYWFERVPMVVVNLFRDIEPDSLNPFGSSWFQGPSKGLLTSLENCFPLAFTREGVPPPPLPASSSSRVVESLRKPRLSG
jgi:hypothetical protein